MCCWHSWHAWHSPYVINGMSLFCYIMFRQYNEDENKVAE